MKIQAVNNSIHFGYNKELNEKVNNKLQKSKRNKEASDFLLEANNFCIKAEDLLRSAEQKNNTKNMILYSDILLNLKPAITRALNEKFPSLKYTETELETYKKERESMDIDEKEYHWLDEMSDELEDYGNWEDFDENIEAVQVCGNSNESKAGDCPKCLEKFTPGPLTPKGLDSLGGMEEVKELLRDKVLFPLRNPELAKMDEEEYGKKYPRGTMFYGPPGCGKSSVIEALAMEADLPMYKLKISKAGSTYINESAINIQKSAEHVYKVAEETGKPVLLMIDELESIAPKRSDRADTEEDNKMVGTLLQILEEARGKNIVILAATNKFDMIDDAVRSRFDDKIYIGLGNAAAREQVLKIHLNKRSKGQALAQNPEELAKVVNLTQGFSNRDIAILTDKAALIARKDNRRDIIADDYIIPVKENQNMKVKESEYKDKQTRPSAGFKTSV